MARLSMAANLDIDLDVLDYLRERLNYLDNKKLSGGIVQVHVQVHVQVQVKVQVKVQVEIRRDSCGRERAADYWGCGARPCRTA